MPDLAGWRGASLTGRINSEQLSNWLTEQRWFAAKSQMPTGLEVLEEVDVAGELTLALVAVHFSTGGSEVYQLVLAAEGETVSADAISDPPRARALLHAVELGSELDGCHGRFSFRHVANIDVAAEEPVRVVRAEQSNSSLVFGERVVMKLFRRLESGINPELEMLRFLTTHQYQNIAPLYGWYEYEGAALAATLATVCRFVADGTNGWEVALAQIPDDTAAFLKHVGELGAVTAQLHSVLASDAGDPAFAPEQSSTELLGLLRAVLDEDVERLFAHLTQDWRLDPIRGLQPRLREMISATPQTPGGSRIRIHGDYHLGQTLHTAGGWTLLDFEGEPARPLTARRSKRSPLRDVASMLRSFSYAAWAVRLQRGLNPPATFEEDAREAFLEAYLAEVEPTLVPGTRSQLDRLLSIFELEKALYELRYELDNRPDWVPIPVAGIARLVEAADA
ncbi:MAG: maltokinase N-terminal cap-like domain-containing protein [Solirubrobacteraceae bacterium]